MEALTAFALFCGAIVAIVTAISLVAKLPPVRWIWGQLVSGPLARWTTSIIKEGALQFHDETVRPQITAIEMKVDELVAASETSWHKDKAWIVGRLSVVEVEQKRLESRQATILAGVTSVLEQPGAVEDVVQGIAAALREASVESVGVVVVNGLGDPDTG